MHSEKRNPKPAASGGQGTRKHPRFRLAIPVEVRTPEGAEPAVQTSSLNISAKGVYFTLAPDIHLASEVEFFMTLPPQMCQGRMIRVHCQGRVVRRDNLDGEGRIGVAAAIDQYEFVPLD